MRTHLTITYKESAQLLQSQRGLLWLFAFSGLLSAFSLLFVSNTELSLLDNAQVVYMMAGTVLAAGALRPKEAIEYLGNFPRIESVLFGASSKAHISETKELIEKYL